MMIWGIPIDWQLVLLLVCVVLWIFTSQEDENVLIKHVLRKFLMYVDSMIFMALSSDNKGLGPKKNPDPDEIRTKSCKTKTIIFIRHGESDWNNVFNKGINPGLIVRLFKAMRDELLCYASPHSVFLDSPLNMEGIEQAAQLRKFIENPASCLGDKDRAAPFLSALRGDSGTSSIVVSSTLRRAVATTTVALWPRVQRNAEPIHILSSLQEISRNVDTYSLSAAEHLADLPFSRIVEHCGGEAFHADKVYDTSNNFGNKSRSFYGIKRLLAFNEWAFKRSEQTIIVGGHSLWFKHFFQTFLPHKTDHEAKTKKITNSGVVAFTLQQTFETEDGMPRYRVDPESLVIVYGGFTTK